MVAFATYSRAGPDVLRRDDLAQQLEGPDSREAHGARASRLLAKLGAASGRVMLATLSRGDGSKAIGVMAEARESQSDTLLTREDAEFVAHAPYVARLMDVFDILSSAYRIAKACRRALRNASAPRARPGGSLRSG